MPAPKPKRTLELAPFKGGKATVKIEIPDGLQVLDDHGQESPKGYGSMRVLTVKDGDKRIVWNARSFAQIQEAKEMFDACVAQGLVPYKVGVNGKASSEVMDEFDPYAEEVIFLPVSMVAGG